MKSIKMCAQILFHPIDCFDLIKRDRDKTPWLTMVIICLLTVVCRIADVYLTAFSLNPDLPEDSNILLLLAVIFIPAFSWVIGGYSTTTLMSGEAKLAESFTGAIYSFVPYIVSTPILIALSYLLSTDTAGLFNALRILVVIWVIILNFLGFMRLNDYGFLKAVGVAVIGIVAALLIWAVIILLFVFTYQAFLFVSELVLEIKNQSLF